MSAQQWHDLPSADFLHGTIGGYTTHRCRCLPCSAAYSEYQRTRPGRRVPIGEHRVPAPSKHGTIGRYRTGCRCKFCREANAAQHRQSVERAAVQPVPTEDHGTGRGYLYRKCRCDACRAWQSQQNAAYKARRKATS